MLTVFPNKTYLSKTTPKPRSEVTTYIGHQNRGFHYWLIIVKSSKNDASLTTERVTVLNFEERVTVLNFEELSAKIV